MSISDRIDMALGDAKASLVIKNVRIFHLTDGSFEDADIAIADDVIVGIGKDYHGVREIDATGLIAVPGFIDSHLHIESSMMTPQEYEKCALVHGVTTAACDPHELANVVGTAAFEYFFDCAKHLSMTLLVRLSSCVPATDLETAGAAVTASDLEEWHRRHPEAALAEFMNVPGILFKDAEVLRKLQLFDFIDGHCPIVGGRALNAVAAVGVRNCHESSFLVEAQEKLRRGLQVLIREGSVARNLDTLMPLLTIENSPFLAFCTDDRNPLDLQEEGYIDRMIARVIAAGVPPLVAYRVASLSAAHGFGLHDRGLIAPGRRADIALLSDLNSCTVERVFVNGKPSEEIQHDYSAMPVPDCFRNTVKCRALTADDFREEAKGEVPVIGIQDGNIVTEFLKMPANAGDVLQVAVIERHGKNGNIGRGHVRGFGLKRGAIASSVGHDSHNLCVVGTNPLDMALAVNALRESQGGFAVANGGKITGHVPLPFAGLFSDQPSEIIADQLRVLYKAVRDCGCHLKAPFLQLAFIPLPVIPHLKLTDKGIVDVDAFKIIH